MENTTINDTRLSPHFTLEELCKTKTGIENVPNEAQVENLKRLMICVPIFACSIAMLIWQIGNQIGRAHV